jgi:sugar/nucleoside kinase (ribokinase family)
MGGNDHEAAATEYLRAFPRCQSLVVTLGSGLELDGRVVTSRVFTPGNQPYDTEASADNLQVVDTTGGGDAFAAGYLNGILAGVEYGLAALMGDVVARLSIGGVGARSTLPNRVQFETVLAQR